MNTMVRPVRLTIHVTVTRHVGESGGDEGPSLTGCREK